MPSTFAHHGDALLKEKDSAMLKYGVEGRRGIEGEDYIDTMLVNAKVTLQHKWSKETREVTFTGVTEKAARVNWNMCGDYEIDLKTGCLKGKKVQLWMVVPDDLRKIRGSVQMEGHRLHEQFKKNKS